MTILLPALYNFVFLGLTLNYNNYEKTRHAIYGSLRGKIKLEQNEGYSARYQVIQLAKDIRQLHNIDSRLCLKLWTSLYVEDLARIITSSSIRAESDIEIQIFIRHQKNIEKLPEDIKVDGELLSMIKESRSTHFVKRIITGGILQANVVFHCGTVDHKEKVLKVILKHFNESGTFDKSFIEKLQAAKEEFGHGFPLYRIKNVYCRGGCKGLFAYTIQNILTTNENLQNTLKESYGDPIALEIEDLSTVYDIPTYKENKEILAKLDEIHELHEDVRIAGADFSDWEMILPDGSEENEQIKAFEEQLYKIENAITYAINRLDTSENASLRQFDDIYEAYGEVGNYNSFRRRLQKLKEEIETD